jgi:hypothetical protein
MLWHRQKWYLILINVTAGSAVIISYIHGIITHPAAGAALWGNVPQGLIPFYTASMFAAAAGYFAFTFFVLFALNPDNTRIANRFSYALFPCLYAVILIMSALWMPFTFMFLEQPSALLWITIRLVLAIVGAGSVGLFLALLRTYPRTPGWAYWCAIIGCGFFCLQTALLDAIVWPVFFKVN